MIAIPLASLAVLLVVAAGFVCLRILDFLRDLVGPPERADPTAPPRLSDRT